MIPGMFGAPLKAISGWLPPVETQDFDVNKIVREESGSGSATASFTMEDAPKYGNRLHLPHGIKGYFDYDQALAVAKKTGKPLFIDFTGHGCTNCRNVESAVWEDRRVRDKFAEEFVVVALYVLMISWIIQDAEKAREAYTRIYGYCLACCLFMHLFINIGMTVGLMPVIGIPLPFLSYGGSSLWAFTTMLFIFLALNRQENKYF